MKSQSKDRVSTHYIVEQAIDRSKIKDATWVELVADTQNENDYWHAPIPKEIK